jgi:hypothetical protein
VTSPFDHGSVFIIIITLVIPFVAPSLVEEEGVRALQHELRRPFHVVEQPVHGLHVVHGDPRRAIPPPPGPSGGAELRQRDELHRVPEGRLPGDPREQLEGGLLQVGLLLHGPDLQYLPELVVAVRLRRHDEEAVQKVGGDPVGGRVLGPRAANRGLFVESDDECA